MLVKFFLINVLRSNYSQIFLYLTRQSTLNLVRKQSQLKKLVLYKPCTVFWGHQVISQNPVVTTCFPELPIYLGKNYENDLLFRGYFMAFPKTLKKKFFTYFKIYLLDFVEQKLNKKTLRSFLTYLAFLFFRM